MQRVYSRYDVQAQLQMRFHPRLLTLCSDIVRVINSCSSVILLFAMTRSSAIAEGPRDASCQLKSCQLPRNSAETTYTTSPDQIDGRKLEI